MHAPVPLHPAVRTTCPYCGVGCGVLARPDGTYATLYQLQLLEGKKAERRMVPS